MRAIFSHGFVYTPRSTRSIAKQRASLMRKLGIPEGHRRIYGHHVPEEHADPLRYWATWIAWKLGREEAERFVGEQLERDYADIAFLREMWTTKLGVSEVRQMVRAVREACYAAN